MSFTSKGAILLVCTVLGLFAAHQLFKKETFTLASMNGIASFTYFDSYAPCCPNNPNYDPNADKSECEDYSACQYPGDFAGIGHKSFDYVKSHNLIAFYDNNDPDGTNYQKNYAGKTIRLTKGGVTFDAIIADTCGNQDCNNCCMQNSQPSGFLVDMEYFTVMRNFGSTDAVDGQIEYQIL